MKRTKATLRNPLYCPSERASDRSLFSVELTKIASGVMPYNTPGGASDVTVTIVYTIL